MQNGKLAVILCQPKPITVPVWIEDLNIREKTDLAVGYRLAIQQNNAAYLRHGWLPTSDRKSAKYRQ
jgi:hypothetical protein